MSLRLWSCLSWTTPALLLLACSQNAPAVSGKSAVIPRSTAAKAPAVDGLFPHLSTVVLAPGTDCPAGGMRVESWASPQAESLSYNPKTDKKQKTTFLCSAPGAKGDAGIGLKGVDGVSVAFASSVVPVSDTDCAMGGQKYETWKDVNANDTYEPAVDLGYVGKKICHGLNGAATSAGANAVVVTTALAVGDMACPTGGVQVESFTDINGDGNYTGGTDIRRSLRTVCNGASAVIVTASIAADGLDATCRNGGTLYTSFTDNNANGAFDVGDTNKVDTKVCRGLKSLVKTSAVALNDATCSAGGVLLESCTDSDNSGTCVSGTDGDFAAQKICAGSGAGFVLATENPGAQCKNGGQKITRYSDSNGNGSMDAGAETTGAADSYSCNGLNWLSKSTPFLAGAGTTADNTACPLGGYRLDFGYDNVNASNGNYAAGTTGTLDALEIVTASKSYSCNGNGVPAGPYISQFQNDSEGDQARFYWQVASTAIDTDWQTYTPAIGGLGTGTVTILNGFWRRVGDSAEFKVDFSVGTAGAGAAAVTASIPAGLVIDDTKWDTGGVTSTVGTASLYSVETISEFSVASVVPLQGQSKVAIIDAGGSNYYFGASYRAGAQISMRFAVPIVGWSGGGGGGRAPTVKLAYAPTRAALDSWACQSQDLAPATVTVMSGYGSCDTTYAATTIPFLSATTGAFSASGKCGVSLAAVAHWEARYFKLCAAEASTPANYSLSSIRLAGRVPAGMVMVHQDDWPMAELAGSAVTPFTYAIDKYESHYVSGSISNAAFTSTTYGANSATLIVASAAGQAPVSNISWYALKKGCANRSAAGFTGTGHAKYEVHLTTDREWFTAAAGTPDVGAAGYCNHSNGTPTLYNSATPSTMHCKSRYGAENMIGNLWEWTDALWSLTSPATRDRSEYYGTSSVVTTPLTDALLGYTFPTDGTFIAKYDYLNLIPSLTQALGNTDFMFDKFFMTAATVGTQRGGSYVDNTNVGRFGVAINDLPTDLTIYQGGRCALVAP